jgi:hypothetical protein
MGLKLLVDTEQGESLEVDFSEIMQCGSFEVDGVICITDTARSASDFAHSEEKRMLLDLLWEVRSYALREHPLPEELRTRLSNLLNRPTNLFI